MTQHFCCVMLPDFDNEGLLPPGIHPSTWEEVRKRFGTNNHRKGLLAGLKLALESLKSAGCHAIYLDGSFVTSKENPGDYDGCWDPTDVDEKKIDPVLMDFSRSREKQKAKFGGELFPDNPGHGWLPFFQKVKEPVIRTEKGIIKIDLMSVS